MTDTVRLRLIQSVVSCAWLAFGSAQALAQDPAQVPVSAAPGAKFDSSASLEGDGSPVAAPESGAVLLGAKVGGIAPLNGLNPFVHGAIEAGYVFPTLNHGLGAYLQVEYSAPRTDGEVKEDFDLERVPSGAYSWHVTQQELVFTPTFLYRATFLSDKITPYVGLGARIYLLKTTTRGAADGGAIDETTERSTKWGLGLPLGAELALGPGKLIGELMFQWGPLKHTLTGDSHLGGASLSVGYRLFL